jgi:hypothetical protein
MDWRKAGIVGLALVLIAGCRLNVGVDGEGTVTSDNGKIDCPGDCKAKLKKGKEITLSAVANDGNYFVSWRGCDSESEETCVVVGKNKNRKVTAVFAEDLKLDKTTVSDDLKACAIVNDFEDATPVSEIDELVCDNSLGAYGSAFDANDIDQLASLVKLEIEGDGDRGLSNLSDIVKLPKIEILRLKNLNLSNLDALQDLNKSTLDEIDLTGNGSAICDDVARLKTTFPGVTISSDDCSSL